MEPINVAAEERRLERAVKAAADATAERDLAIRRLVKVGVTLGRIAKLADLSPARISQIAKDQSDAR